MPYKIKIAVKYIDKLLGINKVKSNTLLLLAPCSCVHTFGLNKPIDIAFIDKNGLIIKTIINAKPNRIWPCANSVGVIERWHTNDKWFGPSQCIKFQ